MRVPAWRQASDVGEHGVDATSATVELASAFGRREVVAETTVVLTRDLEAPRALLVSSRRADRSPDAPVDVVDRARPIVVGHLAGGGPSLETLARGLGLGSRTLQRRLGEAGVPFRVLVEQAREHAARELLDDPNVTLAEVGAKVGFSDASAFYKAFRRWTGLTPGAYRRR